MKPAIIIPNPASSLYIHWNRCAQRHSSTPKSTTREWSVQQRGHIKRNLRLPLPLYLSIYVCVCVFLCSRNSYAPSMHPSVKYTNPNENRRNTLVVCMYYICNIYLTYLRTLNGEVWMLLEHSMLYAVVVDVVVFNLCCIAFVLMFLHTAITKWMIRGDLTIYI